jgi:GNAT superfamily N-acetyltransferase
MTEALMIEAWTTDHTRWAELLALVASQEQAAWVAATYPWHRSTHMLVALQDATIVGFLRFVVQRIGAEDALDRVMLDGEALIEAKVLAFAMAPAARRKGVGRALQEQALAMAKRLGCYQVRSPSGGAQSANHHLKLAMGFGIHPIVRGNDRHGAYFIMPLRMAPLRTPDIEPDAERD